MTPNPDPLTIPDWLVQEVGRLYLDNLALRRELEELTQPTELRERRADAD